MPEPTANDALDTVLERWGWGESIVVRVTNSAILFEDETLLPLTTGKRKDRFLQSRNPLELSGALIDHTERALDRRFGQSRDDATMEARADYPIVLAVTSDVEHRFLSKLLQAAWRLGFYRLKVVVWDGADGTGGFHIGGLTETFPIPPPKPRPDRDHVMDVWRKNMPVVNRCYASSPSGAKGVEGRVIVTLTLSGSGHVTMVKINSTLNDAMAEACIKAKARNWVFPKISRDMTVNLPLRLPSSGVSRVRTPPLNLGIHIAHSGFVVWRGMAQTPPAAGCEPGSAMTVCNKGEGHDYEGLRKVLVEIKQAHLSETSVTIDAAPDISVGVLMATIAAIRYQTPESGADLLAPFGVGGGGSALFSKVSMALKP